MDMFFNESGLYSFSFYKSKARQEWDTLKIQGKS